MAWLTTLETKGTSYADSSMAARNTDTPDHLDHAVASLTADFVDPTKATDTPHTHTGD
jgi:hypothetical protein